MQLAYPCLQTIEQPHQLLATYPALYHGWVDGFIGEVFLGSGVQMNMNGERKIQAGFERQQPARQVEWDPVNINAHQLALTDIVIVYQGQRGLVMLAKLAIDA